jgi:hypothetical protein
MACSANGTKTIIPPISRPDPKLPLPVTVAFESPTIEITIPQIGDPASLLPNGGLGSHASNAIGSHGCGGGIGDQTAGRRASAAQRGIGPKITPSQLMITWSPSFPKRREKPGNRRWWCSRSKRTRHPRNVRIREQLGLPAAREGHGGGAAVGFRPA